MDLFSPRYEVLRIEVFMIRVGCGKVGNSRLCHPYSVLRGPFGQSDRYVTGCCRKDTLKNNRRVGAAAWGGSLHI